MTYSCLVMLLLFISLIAICYNLEFYHIFKILPLFQEAEDKNKLLRSVAGGGLETLSSLRAKWDKFQLMMESHQLMVNEQVRIRCFL